MPVIYRSWEQLTHLAQDAILALSDSVTEKLRAKDRPTDDQRHPANFALLADGHRKGERIPIRPGQVALAIPERFDFDQGYAVVTDHYAYEGRTGNDPDTVLFSFLHQEHRVVTNG